MMTTISSRTEFRFRTFNVAQSNVTWPVGSDSVLLGAWTDGAGAGDALDIGTGSGVLSLLMASRYPGLRVTAVECDLASAEVAKRNVLRSPMSDRISVICADINMWVRAATPRFDLVICNPPYFEGSLAAGSSGRKLARQGDGFGLNDLPRIANLVLRETGRLCVVMPQSRAFDFLSHANEVGLFMHERVDVRHRAEVPPTLALMQLGRSILTPSRHELIMYDGDRPTEAYSRIVGDIYHPDHFH